MNYATTIYAPEEVTFNLSNERTPFLQSISRGLVNILANPLFDGFVYTFEAVGKDKKLIRVQKFRTMEHGADKKLPSLERGLNGLGKPSSDSRVIPSRAWMRKFHVDELPQLLMLASGDLDLVGPRAKSPEYWRKYHSKKHMTDCTLVKPGVLPASYASREYIEAVSKEEHDKARSIAEAFERQYALCKYRLTEKEGRIMDREFAMKIFENLSSGVLLSC